jgi:hypothetical protein
MEFTVSTKPLKSALGLAIVSKNINKNVQRSTVAQLTMNNSELRINTETPPIKTEVVLKGSGDGGATIIVDAIMLKNLVSTITANQVSIKFSDNSIVINDGKSEFVIVKLIDAVEMSLNRPSSDTNSGDSLGVVDKGAWAFLANHQMFAIAPPEGAYPVYQNVWLGDNNDSLVGDFKESIFAHSGKAGLGVTCLITESIVNLLCSVPDNSTMYRMEDTYVVCSTEDSFDYRAEFSPKYESDENGKYRADILLRKMAVEESQSVTVKVADIATVLSQVSMLGDGSTLKDTVIRITIEPTFIKFNGRYIDATIDADGDIEHIEKKFKIALLKKIVSNLPDSTVKISPALNNDTIVGLVFSSGDLTIICAFCA